MPLFTLRTERIHRERANGTGDEVVRTFSSMLSELMNCVALFHATVHASLKSGRSCLSEDTGGGDSGSVGMNRPRRES